jgi:hypothetical protein
MSGDTEADQPPTLMTEDHQNIEQFEERSRYNEEVERKEA